MIYGLSEAELQFLNDKLLLPLKKNGARVFVFGSRATGKQQKFSDIDLLYVESAKTPLPGHLLFQLLSEIEESNFPYKIDLVNDRELAQSYRVQVEQQKVEL